MGFDLFLVCMIFFCYKNKKIFDVDFFYLFFEDFPSNSLEIQRFGRVWREGNGTGKTSYGLDWTV